MRFLDSVSCHRLNMALRVICADAMGRDAVASSLIKTRLVNVEESLRRRREGEPAKAKVSFEGGVLEMRCAYAVGISKGTGDEYQ